MSRILEIKGLDVSIGGKDLVKGVNFNLDKGFSLGILGESGSGKSLTCKAIVGLLPKHFQVGGSLLFSGRDLLAMSNKQRRSLRGRRIGYIMQNPMTAFDPLMTIGGQMAETYKAHFSLPKKEALNKAAAILARMLIREPERVIAQYPHELSGGMLQRVMIGLALSLEPEIIIADEPTTALDVITQSEIMNLFIEIKKQMNTSLIFISHDLGVIARIADHILVLSGGRPVEYGAMNEVFARPKSSHTQYLFDSRLTVMKRFHQETAGMVPTCC